METGSNCELNLDVVHVTDRRRRSGKNRKGVKLTFDAYILVLYKHC